MSLQKIVFNYLTAIRGDSKNPKRVDRLINLVKSYKKAPAEETHTHSKIMAGFINLLFIHMPEVKNADPQLKKVYPVYEYCEKLPKPKRTPKGPNL